MLFTEFRYAFFLALVLTGYWSIQSNSVRKAWLLLASYGFYAAWDWRFLGLILASTAVDYTTSLWISRMADTRRRRRLLLVSIAVNLGILATFKYADFFIGSAADLLSWLGLETATPSLRFILPVGISFYTFQTMSYTIDVFRRKQVASRSLLDVALFVAFFPQLVAGPIVRAGQLLPQFARKRGWAANVDVQGSLRLLVLGFAQKAVLADNSARFVDEFFDDPGAFSSGSAWIVAGLFAIQLYGDFAGYSNMAVGSAGLMGYEIPRNFNYPYLRATLPEVWRNWHMTLTSWINDYVYRPLRRSGQSRWFNYRNLLVTYVAMGLWHGATWGFVFWGAYHGIGMIVFLEWRRRRRGKRKRLPAILGRTASIALTTLFWLVTLPLFRAETLTSGLRVLRSMAGMGGGSASIGAAVGSMSSTVLLLALVVVVVSYMVAQSRWVKGVWQRIPPWAFALGYGALLPVVFALAAVDVQPFVYFQF